MNRIQFTTQAFKTFAEDVKAPLAELRDELKAILSANTTVYVATYWNVDSTSSWHWFAKDKVDSAFGLRYEWEGELRDNHPQKGVVSLFRLTVPVAHAMDDDTINDYIEGLATRNAIDKNSVLVSEYRQNMGSRTGY